MKLEIYKGYNLFNYDINLIYFDTFNFHLVKYFIKFFL
jgi:hypothetical protein